MNKKTKQLLLDILSTTSSIFIALILISVLSWKGAVLWIINILTVGLYYGEKHE